MVTDETGMPTLWQGRTRLAAGKVDTLDARENWQLRRSPAKGSNPLSRQPTAGDPVLSKAFGFSVQTVNPAEPDGIHKTPVLGPGDSSTVHSLQTVDLYCYGPWSFAAKCIKPMDNVEVFFIMAEGLGLGSKCASNSRVIKMMVKAPTLTVGELTASPFVSPKVLFVIRSVIALYTLYFLIAKCVVGYIEMTYMTFNSWLGITVYFILVVALSWFNWGRISTEEIPTYQSILQFFFFGTSQMLSFIVLIIFWTLLHDQVGQANGSYELYSTIVPHVLNFVFTQTELWLTHQTLTLINVVVSIITVFVYTCWIWITHYSFGWDFPYSFFDKLLDIRATPLRSVGWAIVFLIAFTVLCVMIWAESKLRDRVLKHRRLPAMFVAGDSEMQLRGE
eukprot:jgi/Hompol1/1778/HPOL_005728-RA